MAHRPAVPRRRRGGHADAGARRDHGGLHRLSRRGLGGRHRGRHRGLPARSTSSSSSRIRWFDRFSENPQVKAFVNGVTAAAAGAIAGACVVLGRRAIFDLPTALIGLAAFGLLWRLKVPEPILIAAAGVTGSRHLLDAKEPYETHHDLFSSSACTARPRASSPPPISRRLAAERGLALTADAAGTEPDPAIAPASWPRCGRKGSSSARPGRGGSPRTIPRRRRSRRHVRLRARRGDAGGGAGRALGRRARGEREPAARPRRDPPPSRPSARRVRDHGSPAMKWVTRAQGPGGPHRLPLAHPALHRPAGRVPVRGGGGGHGHRAARRRPALRRARRRARPPRGPLLLRRVPRQVQR